MSVLIEVGKLKRACEDIHELVWLAKQQNGISILEFQKFSRLLKDPSTSKNR